MRKHVREGRIVEMRRDEALSYGSVFVRPDQVGAMEKSGSSVFQHGR